MLQPLLDLSHTPRLLPTLQPTLLGPLLVNPKNHSRGQPHLSAASGLVRLGQRLYVVADDELHLGIFDDCTLTGQAPGQGKLLRLLQGKLPNKMQKRKKAKPDLESLAQLPALPGFEAGALLALGSGSKPNRQTGVLVALENLEKEGTPSGHIATVDLTALYAPLRAQFADLNIEGVFLSHDQSEFILLHRGNQGDARSACIRYHWQHMATWLVGQHTPPPAATRVQLLQLGSQQGVPLSPTDGAALPGGAWAFSAVAEATNDSVQDGACVGSAVGIVGPDGQVRQMHMLQGSPKVEGIAVQAKGKDWELTLVTDPDDAAIASQLLQVLLKSI